MFKNAWNKFATSVVEALQENLTDTLLPPHLSTSSLQRSQVHTEREVNRNWEDLMGMPHSRASLVDSGPVYNRYQTNNRTPIQISNEHRRDDCTPSFNFMLTSPSSLDSIVEKMKENRSSTLDSARTSTESLSSYFTGSSISGSSTPTSVCSSSYGCPSAKESDGIFIIGSPSDSTIAGNDDEEEDEDAKEVMSMEDVVRFISLSQMYGAYAPYYTTIPRKSSPLGATAEDQVSSLPKLNKVFPEKKVGPATFIHDHSGMPRPSYETLSARDDIELSLDTRIYATDLAKEHRNQKGLKDVSLRRVVVDKCAWKAHQSKKRMIPSFAPGTPLNVYNRQTKAFPRPPRSSRLAWTEEKGDLFWSYQNN